MRPHPFSPARPLTSLPCTQNAETSRLLYDDPYRSQYGTNVQQQRQQQQRSVCQPDPEALRREREAMERICHAMTE